MSEHIEGLEPMYKVGDVVTIGEITDHGEYEVEGEWGEDSLFLAKRDSQSRFNGMDVTISYVDHFFEDDRESIWYAIEEAGGYIGESQTVWFVAGMITGLADHQRSGGMVEVCDDELMRLLDL